MPHVSGGKVPSYLPPREGGTCVLAWVRSPPASRGPYGFRLCAERAKVLSLGLKNPPEPGLAPFVSNLTGWGWPECGALACQASPAHGQRDPAAQGKARALSGAVSLTRGGQGLRVRGCSPSPAVHGIF